VTFEAAKDVVDVLIELGGPLKPRGARLMSYCCGLA
jgi:hypothetical protein